MAEQNPPPVSDLIDVSMMLNLQIKISKLTYMCGVIVFSSGCGVFNPMQKMEGTYNNQEKSYQSFDENYWTGPFNDSLTLISQNGLIGLINKNGKVIVETKYDRIFSLNNGVAIVCKNNKYGIINSKGEEVSTTSFDFIFNFEESDVTWFYKTENGKEKWGLIDKKGQVVDFQYNTVFRKIKNQYLATTPKGHKIISSKGIPIVNIDFKLFEQLEKNHPFLLNMDPWLLYSENYKTENQKRNEWKHRLEAFE